MRDDLKYNNWLDWLSRAKQPRLLGLITLIAATLVFNSILAGPSDLDELGEEHLETVRKYQKAVSDVRSLEHPSLSSNLALGLRWDEEERSWQTFQSNPGIAVLRVYQDQESSNKYIIAGDRFGSKQLKASISGAIDLDKDQQLIDVYNRELKEEYFGCLPVGESKNLTPGLAFSKTRKFVVLGGFEVSREVPASATTMSTPAGYVGAAAAPLTQTESPLFQSTHAGWGPCFTWVELETGYNVAELTQALQIMNQNAALHCPVADFYHGYQRKSAAERQKTAKCLLAMWKSAIEKESPGSQLVHLHVDIIKHLQTTAEDGDAALPDGIDSGFDFAKRYVHDYTEYKSFHLILLDNWLKFIAIQEKPDTSDAKFLLPDLEEYQPFTRFGADQWFNQHLPEISARI